MLCPHSVIRSRFYDGSALEDAPDTFQAAPLNAVGLPDSRYTLQVYAEDGTGCALCVEACPALDPAQPGRKAINLEEREPLVGAARENVAFFERLPHTDRSRVDFGTRSRHSVPRAAVRVLGRLCRLRRDAVP